MTEPTSQYEMPKAYEPGKVETKWYKFWMDRGYFTPKIDPQKEPFVIIMPPPNITGELHLGHALTATIEDIMTRWHRMKGDPTLWLPGIDHAGIGAQVVVERQLAKEGITRYQLGRDKFFDKMVEWAKQYRHTISEQHMKLGASCDWTRERFTMDEGPSKAVRAAFVNLYNKGLIYKGERIVNWCPRCATALSDLEVIHQDVEGHLWYIRYHLADSNDFITVATTRPETIVGDTAVAVNPNDARCKNLVGKKVILPMVNRAIPIIADEAVDPAFGTGAVKVTPAHDPVDFEIAQRHNLPLINIMNTDATMNENTGPYKGMDRFECRKAILADLEKEGLLVKTEPYMHSIGHCQRCQTIVEPVASKQWFVKMQPLAGPAIEAVTSGKIRIIPDHFVKVYLNWMENIRDWCISRQLWWGHRIPVWYCRDCNEMTVAVEAPKACQHCQSTNIEQDLDMLDTWFSSGLWPHSTLGWPDDTEDLHYFYPTTVMETAYDILFFWVARMIMMGIEDTGKIPFKVVYLHGLIRDEKGEKMSKTRGNVVNPVTLMEKYGTDAMRFALLTGTSPGNDTKLAYSKLEAGRNFANKLWNTTRFVLRNVAPDSLSTYSLSDLHLSQRPLEDRWIISRLNRTILAVNSLLEDYQFGEAQKMAHDFIWGEFCDWYIELSKTRSGLTYSPSPVPILIRVLDASLRLMHPFMPFVTEELWQHLKERLPAGWQTDDSVMITAYPEFDDSLIDIEAENAMGSVIEIVHNIRNARAEYKVDAGKWVEAGIYADTDLLEAVNSYSSAIQSLARAKPVSFFDNKRESPSGKNTLVLVLHNATIAIPMDSMVDLEAERQRVRKDIEQTQSQIKQLEARLSDQAFLGKAPVDIVNREREKLTASTDRLAKLGEELARLQK